MSLRSAAIATAPRTPDRYARARTLAEGLAGQWNAQSSQVMNGSFTAPWCFESLNGAAARLNAKATLDTLKTAGGTDGQLAARMRAEWQAHAGALVEVAEYQALAQALTVPSVLDAGLGDDDDDAFPAAEPEKTTTDANLLYHATVTSADAPQQDGTVATNHDDDASGLWADIMSDQPIDTGHQADGAAPALNEAPDSVPAPIQTEAASDEGAHTSAEPATTAASGVDGTSAAGAGTAASGPASAERAARAGGRRGRRTAVPTPPAATHAALTGCASSASAHISAAVARALGETAPDAAAVAAAVAAAGAAQGPFLGLHAAPTPDSPEIATRRPWTHSADAEVKSLVTLGAWPILHEAGRSRLALGVLAECLADQPAAWHLRQQALAAMASWAPAAWRAEMERMALLPEAPFPMAGEGLPRLLDQVGTACRIQAVVGERAVDALPARRPTSWPGLRDSREALDNARAHGEPHRGDILLARLAEVLSPRLSVAARREALLDLLAHGCAALEALDAGRVATDPENPTP